MCEQRNQLRQRFGSSRGGLAQPHLCKPLKSCCNWEKMNWGGGSHQCAEGRDNEATEGAMNKTRRRNFANRAHLQRLVLQNGLCLLGTCRLLGAAPAPSPSSTSGTQGSSMCSCWILCLPPGEICPGELCPSEHLRLLKHRS